MIYQLLRSDSITVAYLNIHGSLGPKLRDKSFVKVLNSYDVVFLAETWLNPEEEETILLPKGYSVLSFPRPPYKGFRTNTGGIAIMMRESVNYKVCQELSGPDIAVLDALDFYIIGVYLPLSGSDWSRWSEEDPKEIFASTVTACSSTRPVVVVLDANSRTASSNAYPDLPRKLVDRVSNARGQWLLDLCRENGLVILNGTKFDVCSTSQWTCFGGTGTSVVDYCLISTSLLPHLVRPCFKVLKTAVHTDHALLSLTLPCISHTDAILHSQIDHGDSVSPNLFMTRPFSFLDNMADELYKSISTKDAINNHIYGPISSTALNFPTFLVYIAVALVPTAAGMRGGFVVSWTGDRNANDRTYHFDGAQTESRGLLAAVLCSLTLANPRSNLVLYCSSRYCADIFCDSMAGYHTEEYPSDLADVLQSASAWIRAREGSLEFRLPRSKSADAILQRAKLSALDVANLDYAVHFRAPLPPVAFTTSDEWNPNTAKCTKVRSAVPAPSRDTNPTVDEIIDEERDKLESHRCRPKMCLMRLKLHTLLLHCRSEREYWAVLKNLLDKKKPTPQVALSELYPTMRARMNPPLRLPPSFDIPARERAREYNASIPNTTFDTSPEGFFSRLFTIDDIELAKLKIKNRVTTPGLDHWTYRMILSVPDDVLLEIMNKCGAPYASLTLLTVVTL
jgi:hypothetical protein